MPILGGLSSNHPGSLRQTVAFVCQPPVEPAAATAKLLAPPATASTSLDLTGSVTGTTISSGTVTGVAERRGAVTGSISSTGSVIGVAQRRGTITGSTSSSGTVTGTATRRGSVTGGTSSTGQVSGSRQARGSLTAVTASAGTVTGLRAATGLVAGNTLSGGTVTGIPAASEPEPAVDLSSWWSYPAPPTVAIGSVVGETKSTGSVAGIAERGGAPAGRTRSSRLLLAGHLDTATRQRRLEDVLLGPTPL